MTAKIVKGTGIGLAASFVMFILLQIGLITGMTPFNVAPSAAFLLALGIESQAGAVLLHFFYGAFWAALFASFLKDRATVAKGLWLSVGLWVILMAVYSPFLGWGLFGLQGTPELPPEHPLYLAGGLRFPVIALLVHLVYGFVVGWLSAKWIHPPDSGLRDQHQKPPETVTQQPLSKT